MTADLAAEIIAHLDTLDGHPAATALRSLVEHEHIPGTHGMCLSCRWQHPCLTLAAIGHSLGLITEDDIANGALCGQWDRSWAASLKGARP